MKKNILLLGIISIMCLCTGCKNNNRVQEQSKVEAQEPTPTQEPTPIQEPAPTQELDSSQVQNDLDNEQNEGSIDESKMQIDSLMWTSRQEEIPGYKIEDGYFNSVPILQSKNHPEICVELDSITGPLMPVEYDRYPQDALLPVEAFFAGSGIRIVLKKQDENTYAIYYKAYGEGVDITDDKDWGNYDLSYTVDVEYDESGEITSIDAVKE